MRQRILGYFRAIGARRFVGSLAGNLLAAVGVTFFKFSRLGNGPAAAMAMAIAASTGLTFSVCMIAVNAFFFIPLVLFGRRMIGMGTVVNWLLIGPTVDMLYALLTRLLPLPAALPTQIPAMLAGVLVMCAGISLYQTADTGIAPYDAVSLILAERTPVPYFWCRITVDSICTVIAWRLGGIVGLGTLTCAVGVGPVISLFNRIFSEPLMYGKHRPARRKS